MTALSLKDTGMRPEKIMVALLPQGFEVFKHHCGLFNGTELNKADSQKALVVFINLCAKEQLIFLNTEIKPFKIGGGQSIYTTCMGSFARFKELIAAKFGGTIPTTKHGKFLYRFFQKATKKDRQNKNNECTPSIWTQDRTPALAKARAMAEASTSKTVGAHMSPFTHFDYRGQKRLIAGWLKENRITDQEAHELRLALTIKNKSYLKAIKNQSVRIFGPNLRARFTNSAARVVNNAAGMSGGSKGQKPFSVNGFKVLETDKISGNVDANTKLADIADLRKNDHIANRQLEAISVSYKKKKKLIFDGNRTEHKKAYCLNRLRLSIDKKNNAVTGLGDKG